MFRYAIITPESVQEHTVQAQPTYDDLVAIVGGWLEGVPIEGVTAYVNEEGKLMGLSRNPVASQIAHADGAIYPNDWIAGNMIVMGPLDDDGDSTSLHKDWVSNALSTIGINDTEEV